MIANGYINDETLTDIADAIRGKSELLLPSEMPGEIGGIETDKSRTCTSLSGLTIPASVTYINGGGVSGCTSLVKVTFKGTTSYMHQTIFDGCTKLKDIYVPWAEGEVKGAPWGAAKATIY